MIKMNRPTIDELKDDEKFRLLKSFHIDETGKFILEVLSPGKKSKYGGIIGFIIAMSIGCFIGFFAVKMGDSFMASMFLGVLFTFIILLPIHEFIHGLTFKSLGAKNVGYGISWKAGMVYAYAQNFPINMGELKKVALMPFLVLTPTLIILMFVVTGYREIFLSMLMIHTLACYGDFGLAKFASQNKDKEMYTYDDLLEAKSTYFYESLNKSN